MRIGGSLFMIAVGAILAYAVTAQVSWIDIQTVGVILLIVGVIALAVSVYFEFAGRRTEVVQRSSGPYEPNQPPYPQEYPQQYQQRTTAYDQGYYRS